MPPTHIALLRAVNVGGTGKLPMAALRAMAEELGFTQVRSYIASGNLLLQSPMSATEVRVALEARLLRFAGKPVGVVVRSPANLAAVLAANPFSCCGTAESRHDHFAERSAGLGRCPECAAPDQRADRMARA